MFFYSPVLLMQGDWLGIVQATVSASIGVWFLAGSTEGWFGGRLPMALRVILFFAALSLMHPGGITDVLGLGIGLPIYFWQRMRHRAQPA